ncbi:MAG: Hsp20/alpha crystallin family protein [Thaumarchaeota archaeon]|nr:Hsp20/alpha crystallin family protein [Candidatus Calditenuaceae archaeon]MDW8042437.1 Hsp20/alpha crystallin family protein [Nitrososphaerota archaeon]
MYRRRRSLFDLIREIEEEIDRDIERFLTELRYDEWAGQCLQPLHDLRETEDEFVLSIDMPGVKKEEIDLKVSENSVSVYAPIRYGVRVSRGYERTAQCYRLVLELPGPVDTNSVTGVYRNGILEVKMRKRGVGTRIPIE